MADLILAAFAAYVAPHEPLVLSVLGFAAAALAAVLLTSVLLCRGKKPAAQRNSKLIPTIVREQQRAALERNLETIRLAEFRRQFNRDWDEHFRDRGICDA